MGSLQAFSSDLGRVIQGFWRVMVRFYMASLRVLCGVIIGLSKVP